MTNLKVSKYDPRLDVDFGKCPNLRVLFLISLEKVSHLLVLRKIPVLCSMTHLSRLVLCHLKVVASSLAAFDGLFALHFLEFDHCIIDCDWSSLGVILAQTPVKNLIFEYVECHVDDIESLLDSVQLDYLYLSNFRSPSPGDVFRTFQDAFHSRRENPRKSFLIEQDGYARNYNGIIFK